MGVIYCTHNKINGKMYIGLDSRNLPVERYPGSGTILKKAIKKYGIENFEKIILEEVPDDKLEERERYWLEKVDAASNSCYYNLVNDAGRISEKRRLPRPKNPVAWNKGKHYTPEQYERCVIRGQKKRVETIKARNKERTPEERKKIYSRPNFDGESHSRKMKALYASMTEEEKKARYSGSSGKRWYKSTTTTKNYYGLPDTQPVGFVPGRHMKRSKDNR